MSYKIKVYVFEFKTDLVPFSFPIVLLFQKFHEHVT